MYTLLRLQVSVLLLIYLDKESLQQVIFTNDAIVERNIRSIYLI